MRGLRRDRSRTETDKYGKAEKMGFLIRSAFWLSLLLLIIPFGGTSGSGGDVDAVEAISAAREAFHDMSGICERKPDVCETAGAALETIGIRAREGAKIAYETLDERFGEEAGQPIHTGTVIPQRRPTNDVPARDPFE
jgi:hypothetical protein